jgi:hypothetical protein
MTYHGTVTAASNWGTMRPCCFCGAPASCFRGA